MGRPTLTGNLLLPGLLSNYRLKGNFYADSINITMNVFCFAGCLIVDMRFGPFPTPLRFKLPISPGDEMGGFGVS